MNTFTYLRHIQTFDLNFVILSIKWGAVAGARGGGGWVELGEMVFLVNLVIFPQKLEFTPYLYPNQITTQPRSICFLQRDLLDLNFSS